MRFFKAFNILHRRTKSATFVPGPPPELSFVDASYSNRGNGPSRPITTSPSLLFELATTKETPVPPNFNHLADRVSGLRWPRRHSGRSSTATTLDAMEKEQFRLKESMAFWLLENSKLQATLRQCQSDLLAERNKVATLTDRINSDSLIIERLRQDLSNHGRSPHGKKSGADKLHSTGLHSYSEHVENPHLELGMVRAAVNRDPNVASGPSSKLRSMDEYSSALRMTLNARKALRDQRKITKFWKTEALAKSSEVLITPSVSAISSIQEESLSSVRQAALKALIIRRGQTLSLLSSDVPASVSSSSTLGTVRSNLAPSISNSSSSSNRLGPLASESMKAEVNLMFGSRGNLNRLVTPPKKPMAHSNSLSNTESVQSSMTLSLPMRKSLNIESFSDLNGFFDRTFGSRSHQSTLADGPLSGLSSTRVLQSPDSLHVPCIASGSSGLFEDETVPCTPSKNVDTTRQSLKKASKDCTPRRSWQTYISRAPNHPQSVQVKGSNNKENIFASVGKPTCVDKKKQSRLPIPVLGRRNPENHS